MTDQAEPRLSTPKALAIALLPIAGIAGCAIAGVLIGTRGWWSMLPWIALLCIALAPGTAGWVAARARASNLVVSVPAIAFAVVVLAFAVDAVIRGQRQPVLLGLLLYLVPLGWVLGSCLIARRLARSGHDLLGFLVGAVVIVAFVAIVLGAVLLPFN